MSRSLFRPWTQESIWWSLVHLLCGLFIGYLVTVFVFVGLVLSVSTLIVLPVAIILSWLGFMIIHGMARVERSRYRALLGVDLADPMALQFASEPSQESLRKARRLATIWSRYKARLSSGGRWRELLYLLLRLPVSAIEAGLLVVLWPGSLVLATLPFWAGRLPNRSADFGLFAIGSGPGVWLGALIGVAVLLYLAPWGTVVLAQVDVTFGRSLLAYGSRSEMEQTVDRLETSRAAAIEGAEAERRRIERDLHDGAQQRLIAAAMDLGVAKERLVLDPPAGRELVDRAHVEVKAAMRELRDLVRGIHPVILEDRGLDAALSAVIARVNVPVELNVVVDVRPGPAVESAAYFIVCEALTNITRHSRATRAAVDIERRRDDLFLTIRDDGVGGADPTRGTGLHGLEERVASLGGTFKIESPRHGPTTIEVEIPCGS
ncbi:MAG: sensor histidine kinase [Microthrixaceae bacterium]